MGSAEVFLTVAVIVLITVLGVWVLQHNLTRSGIRRTGSTGDAMGNLIDVFDPAQSRASRDLQDQQHVGPVTPTPDPDPDDPIRIDLGRDGVPT